MKLIGITGGMGSGKTTVAALFQMMGIPVYESDKEARRIMETDDALRENIIALLGPSAYTAPGQPNRAWIASQVFDAPDLLAQLNAIIHPAVYADLLQWSSKHTEAPYLMQESAILLEENLTGRLSALILVVAPVELRIERVMARDLVDREQVVKRMKHQWTDDKKIPFSDYVIYNDGERSLIRQVMDIHEMILNTDRQG